MLFVKNVFNMAEFLCLEHKKKASENNKFAERKQTLHNRITAPISYLFNGTDSWKWKS